MSSTCAVYLAIDAHDALEEIVVASTPALHVAIMYCRFSIDFQNRKIRIWTSIAPRAARESLAEHCDPPCVVKGERRGAPPHAPKLVDTTPRVRVQTQNYRISTSNAPRPARESLAERREPINMGKGGGAPRRLVHFL
ncbi:hypothetical protein GGF50DRAFT_121816 [Schizophyllum commune]